MPERNETLRSDKAKKSGGAEVVWLDNPSSGFGANTNLVRLKTNHQEAIALPPVDDTKIGSAEVKPIGHVMAAPTREEIEAKLAAVEARTETRFVELSGKMDRLSDSIESLTGAVTGVRNEVAGVRSEVKEENRFTRWTVGITLVASLIAFAGALWTTQGNLLSAFQASLALHSQNQAAQTQPAKPNQ